MKGGSDLYKPYYFLKERNEDFQMHICKLLSPHISTTGHSFGCAIVVVIIGK